MFKAKISLLYLLLIVLSVVTVWYAVDASSTEAEARLVGRVRDAFPAFEKMRELQELSMHGAATALATSEVEAYLRTLEDFRGDLVDIEREVYSRWPASKSSREEESLRKMREDWVGGHTDFLDRFTEQLASRIEAIRGEAAWQKQSRDDFMREKRRTLQICSAYAVNNCFFQMTYFPLKEAAERILPATVDAFRPTLAILVDDRGVGWARSDNATWSDKVKFGETYPIIHLARRQGVVHDLVLMDDGLSYYFVTVVPIRGGERHIGSIMVALPVDEKLARELSRSVGAEVTLVLDDKPIQSTMKGDDYDRFVRKALEGLAGEDRYRMVRFGDDRYEADSFFYYRPDRASEAALSGMGMMLDRKIEDLRVVLSADKDVELGAFATVKTLVPILGGVTFLVGVLLILLLIRNYTSSFEMIEQGIHEVINGNHEFQFNFQFREMLADSMAQSLNLMVAVLTGRPSPDDDGETERWVESLLIEDKDRLDAKAAEARAPAIVGARAPGAVERSREELAREPAEQYYKRLYAEYVAARGTVGESNDRVTYVKFVEKLVKNEKALKRKYDCRIVRFNVLLKEGKVVLSPVPIA